MSSHSFNFQIANTFAASISKTCPLFKFSGLGGTVFFSNCPLACSKHLSNGSEVLHQWQHFNWKSLCGLSDSDCQVWGIKWSLWNILWFYQMYAYWDRLIYPYYSIATNITKRTWKWGTGKNKLTRIVIDKEGQAPHGRSTYVSLQTWLLTLPFP